MSGGRRKLRESLQRWLRYLSNKLPVLSGGEVIKALSKIGFKIEHQKGSHVVMARGDKGVVIPLHRELDRGTLKSIIRQSGLTREEFLSLLKKRRG